MNNPTPIGHLSPLGQASKGKSNVRLAVITILALHGVFLGGLLLQGCRKPPEEAPLAGTTTPSTMFGQTNDLASLTNINPYLVDTNGAGFGGQTLTTPGYGAITPTNAGYAGGFVAPGDTTPITPATTEYVVKPGDNPGKIAKAHGVSLNAFMQANPGIDPRRLQIGQKLQVPAPVPATTTPGAGSPPDGSQVYVVKSGDNLTRIARQYHVTVRELRAANNLKTDRISVGQKLKIPTTTPATPADAGYVQPPPANTPAGPVVY
ncbi:MAG TPA: LysM peptidoglycan-binding domain-containing protein [Verrucomicrobiota bacterium]|nr:LysM peptidoglycan-binding domain-containing protein [Verrucomicrobiota bacterium]HNU52755.1 LysM peptidoglycan-binding domain-containing protein [Verrucomicrobiota bacterium]